MKTPLTLISAIGLLVAVIVGIAVYLFAGPIRYHPASFFTLLNAPQVVKDMTFVVERPGASGLARIMNGGIETHWFEGVQFRSLDQRAGVLVAVIEQVGNGAVDVAEIRAGELIPLTSDGAWKGDVALSPDATRYAFTTRDTEPALDAEGKEIYNVGHYRTEVRSYDGTYLQSFTGNHPYFINPDSVLLFTEEGLVSQRLDGTARTVREDDLVFLAEERPYFGKNGTMIVRNPISDELMVFEFISIELLTYQLVGSLPLAEKDFGLSRETVVYQGSIEGGTFMVTEFTNLESAGAAAFSLDATYFAPLSGLF